MFKYCIPLVTAAVALSDVPARAVIVTGPQGRNLTAPAGDLAGSGWDLQGQYGDFLGTPITPTWFVTAAHFGGAGNSITLADGDHPLTGVAMPIAGTDLVLRQVSVPFTNVATLYNPAIDAPLTTADRLVVFGRGSDRGAALPGKGYDWGTFDHAKAWGTNNYAGLAVVSPEDVLAGSPFAAGTSFLAATFDNNGDPNEATVSVGDSGGGVFVRRDDEWKLVGINYGVELFRDAPAGPDRWSAIYDARGLYGQNAAGDWVYLDPMTTPSAVPQTWYASYIPDALGQILANPMGVPEPASLGVVGVIAMLLGRRRINRPRPASAGRA